jgi:hypothetical protein
MKFFLDQDVPAEIAQVLRYWGHDLTLLKEALPLTALDQVVFRHAQDQRQIIITCNRGHYLTLATQAISSKAAFAGLIVLIRRRTRQAECAHLLQLLRRAGQTGLDGNINFA